VHVFPGARESLAQIRRQRFSVTLSFGPLVALASQVGIDVSLICQIVRYGAINLFEAKKLKILADGFRGFTTPECMHDRIQGDPCGGNIIVSVTSLDVLLRHTVSILLSSGTEEKVQPVGRVRDIKVEIPATPLEPPDRSASALSAFICVHLRPDVLFFRPNAKTKTSYWLQMNADERG
jgi:hypothetical protein